jgi:4-hydroxy-3-methylbut-2-enyl diphosphate reductase IspH
MTVEEEVEEYNQRVYKGEMPAHNKSVLRKLIEKENEFWEKEAVRIDNNNSHDDY